MIRKPPGAERESTAHAAVGRAVEIGGEVRDVSRRTSQLVGKGCLFLWFLPMMAFGLLMSDTPWWFKLLLLAVGYGIYRLIKAVAVRVQDS
jgi:hypothetical protein